MLIQVVVHRSWSSGAPQADLTIDEVTLDALRELGRQYTASGEGSGDWYWRDLAVDWEDGIVVEYSLWGLTVTEAFNLIHSAQVYVEPVEESEDSGVTLPVPIPDPSPWQVVPLE